MVRYGITWQPYISEGNEVELAAQIKRHRTEKGLSQEDLAAKIYVSRQTVSNWETDKTYPDVESLLLLSVLFDVTIDELIKGDMEAMKKVVNEDARSMNRLTWISVGFIAAALVAAVLGTSIWSKDWGLVPPTALALILLAGGVVFLGKVEQIKKKHDIVTYREILAFEKGEPIDRDNKRSQQARKHKAFRIVLQLAGGALVGGLLGYFAYGFFN